MSPTTNLCVLLVSCLVFTTTWAQVKQDVVSKPGNSVPLEERDEDRLDASYGSKKEERAKGKDLEGVKGEVAHLIHAYSKHVRDNNCGAILQMFDPGFMTIDVDGSTTKGLEAIQKSIDSLGDIGSTNVTTLAVSSLGKNSRFVFQHVREVASDHEGNLLYSGEGFIIWKRHHNGLRAHLEIFDMEE